MTETLAQIRNKRLAQDPALLKGQFPSTAAIEETAKAAELVDEWLAALNRATASGSVEDVASLFIADGLWRDQLIFTGTFRSFHSNTTIGTAWVQRAKLVRPSNFKQSTLEVYKAKAVSVRHDVNFIDGNFTFEAENPKAHCTGGVFLVKDTDGKWRAWTAYTLLEDFVGYEEIDPITHQPCNPTYTEVQRKEVQSRHANGTTNGVRDWTNKAEIPQEVDVLILGCGQSGLSLSGRCQGFGLSYLAVDKNDNLGDNWMNRYEFVKLHTPKLWTPMPYQKMSPEEPEYMTRKALGQMFLRFASTVRPNVSMSTVVTSGKFDHTAKQWTFGLRRDGKDYSIKAKHVAFATGSSSQDPYIPDFPGREKFKGDCLHSVNFKNASQWKGKRAIVIGTANTGHDVSEDFANYGASSVTMVQRNQTYIIPAEYLLVYYGMYYNDKTPTEIGDRMTMSMPMSANRHFAMNLFNVLSGNDLPRFENLSKAGFKVVREGDLMAQIFGRGGGHYVDIGCSKRIADGEIKVKAALITEFTETGLKFNDGTSLDGDVIVFATGFKDINMVPTATSIVGAEETKDCEETWGLDEEGEIRGVWKPNGHEHLWFMPGNVASARYNSRLLALQILAAVKGFRLPVYNDTPVVQ